jgi:hydroxypyruvate isomerase
MLILSFRTALQLVKGAGSDFLKLQLDIFHLQMLEGNLTNRIKELLPYTGISFNELINFGDTSFFICRTYTNI